MSETYYIKTNGFLGDILFQTSIAKSLKQIDRNNKIIFYCIRPQLWNILNKVPFIDVVTTKDSSSYDIDEIITTQQYNNRNELPTLFHQTNANIPLHNRIKDFKLDIDLSTNLKNDGIFRIGVPLDWELKSFNYTLDEYKRGIDIPNFGYGGKHRDITYMLNSLLEKCNSKFNVELIRLGLGCGHSLIPINEDALEFEINSYYSMSVDLSNCNLVIGSEGGITNLSNALGIPTHTTTDFQMQLYGYNGVLEKVGVENDTGNEHLQIGLGPFQFDDSGIHTYSKHIASDEEVVNDIFNKIKEMNISG